MSKSWETKVHAQQRNSQSDPIYPPGDKTVPFGSFPSCGPLRQSGIQTISVVPESLEDTLRCGRHVQ